MTLFITQSVEPHVLFLAERVVPLIDGKEMKFLRTSWEREKNEFSDVALKSEKRVKIF